jgi:hypothetical protein
LKLLIPSLMHLKAACTDARIEPPTPLLVSSIDALSCARCGDECVLAGYERPRMGAQNQGTAMMRTGLIWFGRASLLVGMLLIAANAVMHFKGLSPSYNVGDPSKDQFVLISFWHVGAVLAMIGIGAVYIAKRN